MKKNECAKAYSDCRQQQTLLSLDWKIACVLINSQDSDSQEEKNVTSLNTVHSYLYQIGKMQKLRKSVACEICSNTSLLGQNISVQNTHKYFSASYFPNSRILSCVSHNKQPQYSGLERGKYCSTFAKLTHYLSTSIILSHINKCL